MNWGDISIEKLIQKFCFQFHLVRKKLCPKNDTMQFSGTGFRYRFLVRVSLALGTIQTSDQRSTDPVILYGNVGNYRI